MGVGLLVRFLVVNPVHRHPFDGSALKRLAGAKRQEIFHRFIRLETPVRQKPVVGDIVTPTIPATKYITIPRTRPETLK